VYDFHEVMAMRRLLGVALIALLVLGAAAPAWAGSAANVALGLAAFAVFNQLLFASQVYAYPPAVYAPAPVYSYPAPVVYVSPRVVYAAPPAPRPAPAVVRYPHGSWELRGDGINVAYQWVWIPATPPPPPGQLPAPPPAAR
jgi:hypothetical protein